MKFQLSTKPLSDALNLGVIPANISKYFRLSCLAQLTATKNQLRINLQASSICTEILLKGLGDEDGEVTAFVDCLVLKQIVATLESSTVTIEYTDGGIILHSGSSKLTLPQIADSGDGELKRPSLPNEGDAKMKLDLSDWKFVKDHQMYAVALSFVHPIYMNVWIGESGDVIVGDFDNSLFTFSKKNKLGKTCLLTDTIINLFNSLPEGAEITAMGDSYWVGVKTDGYEYASEFTPKYEGDEIGNYRSDVFLSTVVKDLENSFQVAVAPISKFLSQADLLSSGNTKVQFTVSGNQLQLKDDNIDCKVPIEGKCVDFSIPVNSELLKPIISHVDSENVKMSPVVNKDEAGNITEFNGLVIWADNLSVVVGALDEQA